MKRPMAGTSNHEWERYAEPLSECVIGELRSLLGLDDVEGQIKEIWVCTHCQWTKLRDTYGSSYIRGRVLADDEPPCE